MNEDDLTISLSSAEMKEKLKQSTQEADEKPAALLVIGGTLNGTIFDLHDSLISCGRNKENTISLQCFGISRLHCTLSLLGDGNYAITDNQSKNGTYVNNQKIAALTHLGKGDIIKLGTMIIKYLPKGDLERLTYDKLHLEANTDQFTGCFNKNYFNELLEIEVKKSVSNNAPLSLLFFDIDRFKIINDTYGHDAGDYVLIELCQLLRSQGIREEHDIFGRNGGDEFAILLLNTQKAKAFEIAERIRLLIANSPFTYEQQQISVTLSMGLTCWDKTITTGAQLLRQSDQAMYQSKQNGRNQVSQ